MSNIIEKKAYATPETIEIGRIIDLTGHCSSGCNHDSITHPDEFIKSASDEEIQEVLDCG